MTHGEFEEARRLAGLVNITADNIHAAFRALKPGEEVAVARLFVDLVEAFGDVVDTLQSDPAPAAKRILGTCLNPYCSQDMGHAGECDNAGPFRTTDTNGAGPC